MKKGFFIIAMGLLLGMTACNRASLVGTWIEPADDSSVFGEYGLKLNSDGTIESINMGYREYQTWEKVDDMLILKGRYTGTNPRDFVDSLWIEELTEDRLVLKDFGNYSVTYQRKVE